MSGITKDLAIQILEKLGYKIHPSWRHERYAQSEYLSKLFNYLEIDCVFDVGANDGQFCQFLRHEVGYKGPVISFEPIPANVEKLKAAAKSDGQWIIKPFALGKTKGKVQFNVMKESQFSSFLEPDHESVKMFMDNNQISEKIEVEVMTLAEIMPDILKELHISSPYLKLDTQGFDLEVAYGAGGMLSSFKALQSEASVKPIYKNMPSYSESIATYIKMGFELSGIYPNNPSHFPQMIEFDLHMINRNCIKLR